MVETRPVMVRMRLASFFLLLALISIGCASRSGDTVLTTRADRYSLADPASLPDAYTIPLRLQSGFLFASGQLNDQRPGWYLFDTGSNLTLIDQGIANRLQLPVLAERSTLGIAGRAGYTIRPIDRLSIGGLQLDMDRAGALSMHPLTDGLGLPTSGLIGFNAIANHPFTLDYQDPSITIYHRDRFTPPPDATAERLVLFRGLPAVIATLGGGQEVLLILDSGADNAVSLPATCALWPGILAVGQTSRGVSRGVGGQIHTRQGWLKSLELFNLDLRDVPVTFEPTPPGLSNPRYAVGRIGGDVLSSFRLTFDARGRTLYAEFVPESP